MTARKQLSPATFTRLAALVVALLATLLVATLASPPAPASAQQAGTHASAKQQAAASTHALAWLAGKWEGTVGAATVEEHWSEAEAGTMMGMFRWVQDGKVVVYEFLILEDTPAGPVMRFKHFDAAFHGWEEKDQSVVLHATSVTEDSFVLERTEPAPRLRITYRRDGVDGLVSYLDRWKGETVTRVELRLKRTSR